MFKSIVIIKIDKKIFKKQTHEKKKKKLEFRENNIGQLQNYLYIANNTTMIYL